MTIFILMGLFDLFSKKPSGPSMEDMTWISKQEKWMGALKLLAEEPNAVFVYWFADTANEFKLFCEHHTSPVPELKDTRRLSAGAVEGKTVIFLEHYPTLNKERELIQHWNAKKIYVLNAMDEPLLLHAGGASIAAMMTQMGLEEGEAVRHALIGKSIRNLQEKLEKKVSVERSASDAEEWFRKNLSELT